MKLVSRRARFADVDRRAVQEALNALQCREPPATWRHPTLGILSHPVVFGSRFFAHLSSLRFYAQQNLAIS
jgi:hypothetical protein